jgi:transcriptional regulator with XRE-family HTH domain
MRLVEKIVTLLRQRGLKQADLAAAIGVAPSRVTLWLQGTGVPNAYQLKAIATALNVPIDYLVDDSVNDPGEVRAGLTEKERLLLGAVGFIEGGIDEALHRMLNRRPATEPATELVRRLRAENGKAWELVQREVMPKVVQAVKDNFGAEWDWIQPEKRAWSAESSVARQVKEGNLDIAIESLEDLAHYLEWAAKQKCLKFLESLVSNPSAPEAVVIERDQEALKVYLEHEAVQAYLEPLGQLLSGLNSEEERVVCQGRLTKKGNEQIAEDLRKLKHGAARPASHVKDLWLKVLRRFSTAVSERLKAGEI